MTENSEDEREIGVEELDDLAKRTAKKRFERYLSREYE